MYILKVNIKSSTKIDNNRSKKKLLEIKKKFKFNHIQISNGIKTKTKNKIFTLLRSPHVNKKSREHFIFKNYSLKINIYFLNIFSLFNFLLSIKSSLNKNNVITTKIIKKLCL
jgi:small subunit ribosomal protein S10